MKRLILFILAAALIVPAFGQRNKKDDEAVTPAFVEGIVYSLPLTGIRIHVKAVKQTFEAGPYASYAEQLLGISDAKTTSWTKWEIDGIRIETFSEPDPDQVFKALGDASFLLNLTSDGCLAGINSTTTISETNPVFTNSFVSEPDYEDGFSFANFNDSPMYSQGDSSNNFRPVRISTDQKAANAAARILQCRLNQYDIAAGLIDEFHPDGEAYGVSLQELKNIEKNYLSLFTGRTIYGHETFSFDFIPSAATEKGETVFRFSDEKGVVPASDLSGKPVMIKLDAVKNLTGKFSGLAKSDNPLAGKSGIYYRMPGVATINVNYELKTIATARATIAQLGTVAPVPEDLLFGEYSLEFHPATGAIKSVSRK